MTAENITIAGQHMDLGASLKTFCEEKIAELDKYFDKVTTADISFTHEGPKFEAEVTAHANGIILRAIGLGEDAYVAMTDATNKLEKQLQKYKGRLKKHIRRRQQHEGRIADMQKLAAAVSVVEETGFNDTLEDDNWFEAFAPQVKHREVNDISPMSVDEAIMQMDLLHKPAFLFQNVQTGEMNMIYRDTDHSIKWVEAHHQT